MQPGRQGNLPRFAEKDGDAATADHATRRAQRDRDDRQGSGAAARVHSDLAVVDPYDVAALEELLLTAISQARQAMASTDAVGKSRFEDTL